MNNAFRQVILAVTLAFMSILAQAQSFQSMYRAVDATILRVEGNTRAERVIKGATILLSRDASQLNISLQLPAGTWNSGTTDTFFDSLPRLPFNLKINIDRNFIQENITSAKTLNSSGKLLLNGITGLVEAWYVFMPSGTDDEGNFLLNLLINFNAADFNLPGITSATQFTISFNRAKVNRL